MFSVEMLPAKRGDCLWIEYGDAAAPKRILIDGGLASTGRMIRERLEALPEDQRRFELVVISHIDLDHIGGVLELLRRPPSGLKIDDFWFNGWDELVAARSVASAAGVLGPKQGEAVSWYIDQLSIPHNIQFGGGPVIRMADADPPVKELDGGMTLTILGPTPERLDDLQRVWKKKIESLNLTPGQAGEVLEAPDEEPDVAGVLGNPKITALLAADFKEDKSEANGSSIALLLEYEDRQFLASGDALACDLSKACHQLAATSGTPRLKLTAAKLSHHGGKKNTSVDLVQNLFCRHWFVSTDGSSYKHPNGESLARVIRHSACPRPVLHFNYNSDDNAFWRKKPLQREEKFSSNSPAPGSEGLEVRLDELT